jgi:hypothetical protein
MADLISDQLKELSKSLAENSKERQKLGAARSKEESSGKRGELTKQIQKLLDEESGLESKKGKLEDRLSNLTGLPKIMETMAAETKELKRSNETDAVGKKLEKLNSLMSSTSNSKELNKLFKETLSKLEDPSLSDEEKELLNKQIDEIKKGAESEENRREAAKIAEENNSRLSQMAEGLEGMGNKFDKFSDNFKKGAGLIGALGAIGLLLFSPETLYKIVDSVITFFDDMYKTITSVINGDWQAGITFIKDHIVGVGVFIGSIAALFGGTILKAAGSLLRTVKTLGKVFGKLFLPFTIVMGLVGAITGFIEGFKESGILGGIKGAITGLVNMVVAAPLDLLKDGVAWILGKMGFENASEALESFSFSDLFTSMIDKLFSTVSSIIDWIGSIFNVDIGGMLTSMLEGLGFAHGFITDIIFAPIDAAINWVMGMFGFETPEEGFSLKSMIADGIEKVKNLFTSMLDFIPSFSDIKEGLLGMMPSWMKKFISDDEPEEADIPEPAGLKRSRARRAEAQEDRDSIDSESALETRQSIESETPETVLESRPATERSQRMIRGNDDESVARISQTPESTPLEPRIEPTTTPGAVLSSTNNMMDNKAQAAAQTNMTIINASSGGGGRSGGNVNSATAITNNISHGFTTDDAMRIDFANIF